MTVTFKLKSGLDRFLAKQIVQCEINNDQKVIDVLKQIKFPVDMAGVIIVDGKKSNMNSVLHGGEMVKVFPPVFN